MHLLGLQRVLAATSYRALTDSLPMLRAVKDANELARLGLAGAAADATYSEIVHRRFAGRRETDVAADHERLPCSVASPTYRRNLKVEIRSRCWEVWWSGLVSHERQSLGQCRYDGQRARWRSVGVQPVLSQVCSVRVWVGIWR
jgi:hypothetical protein